VEWEEIGVVGGWVMTTGDDAYEVESDSAAMALVRKILGMGVNSR
jgi:hypothetical protein